MINWIHQKKAVPVFSNEYGILYNDEVVGPTGNTGRYLRWKWANPGVLIVPHRDGLVALANMYRYPIQKESIEFPGGGMHEAETPEDAARRELAEELGLEGTNPEVIGSIWPDSGILDSEVRVVSIEVPGDTISSAPRQIEPMESIDAFRWYSVEEVRGMIAAGKIKAACTIAAFMLYRERQPYGRHD